MTESSSPKSEIATKIDRIATLQKQITDIANEEARRVEAGFDPKSKEYLSAKNRRDLQIEELEKRIMALRNLPGPEANADSH